MTSTLTDSVTESVTEPATTPSLAPRPRAAALRPGTHVEVKRRFDDAWARGFQIHAAHDDGYQLRRLSDGAILPVAFPASDIRRNTEPG